MLLLRMFPCYLTTGLFFNHLNIKFEILKLKHVMEHSIEIMDFILNYANI